MKAKTTKYLCDICGKEVPRNDYYKGRIVSRYIVKLDCDFLTKQKVDLCGQCYKNMTDWIRSKTEES